MDLIYLILEKILPFSWIEFNFMKNALLAILLITPLFGLLGTMVVSNKMSFFSDALGHCALTGIALGVILNITNFSLSMIIFSVIFSLGISGIMNSEISSSDSIIGVFSSIGVALGIFLLSFTGINTGVTRPCFYGQNFLFINPLQINVISVFPYPCPSRIHIRSKHIYR